MTQRSNCSDTGVKKVAVQFEHNLAKLEAEKVQKKLLRKTALFFILIVGVIIIGNMIPNFLSYNNLINITRQSAMIAMCAIGMSFVLISGGMDLSTPGIIALSPMITGLLMLSGVNMYIAIVIGLISGAVIGTISGMLISNINIPAFIATYVIGQIATGVALVLGKGASIGGLPRSYMMIGNGSIANIPYSTIIMVAYVIIGTVVIEKMRIRKHIYAHGGSEITVKFEGVNINKLKYFVYAVSGFCTASAGILLSAQMNAVHPTQGADYLLDSVAAATIGGVSLMGGEGKVWMAAVGALFMGVLRNALTMLGIHPFFQNIFVGTVIIVVVAINSLSKNRDMESAKAF